MAMINIGPTLAPHFLLMSYAANLRICVHVLEIWGTEVEFFVNPY